MDSAVPAAANDDQRVRRRRRAGLLASMALSVLAIGALAEWDRGRESQVALEEFAQQQARLAQSVAESLGTRLLLARREPALSLLPAQLAETLGRIARSGESELLLLPPGARAFVNGKGALVESPPLSRALEAGQRSARLERPEAVVLGLPLRMAFAGLATLDAPEGRWGVAVVTSAFHERDRGRRATRRLLLAILLAAALVGAFGGLVLRAQRRDLTLQQALALAEAARERDERLERLGQAATMLTMASGMAHELGTPLNVIAGRAEQLLERTAGDEKAQRASRAILEQTQSIDSVIRGFLALARGGVPALTPQSPAAIVQSALALVEHRFAEAGVALAANLGPALPAISCEPRLLEHALVNLLLNACDACARGGHVELSAEPGERHLRFIVLDDGAGISPQDAARVTEPFFTTKPAGQGTGLGLAIVSEIAKSHRGALSLEAAKPRGTRVTLQLPLSAPEGSGREITASHPGN